MLRKADVPVMMTRVQLAMSRAEDRGGAARPLHFISPEGDDSDLTYLRRAATISLDVHSGSARPLIGPVVLAAKRWLRRGLRWYLAPVVEQQSRFNHAALDLIEKARLENEQLASRLEHLAAERAGLPPE
jgi:hypothetical protein